MDFSSSFYDHYTNIFNEDCGENLSGYGSASDYIPPIPDIPCVFEHPLDMEQRCDDLDLGMCLDIPASRDVYFGQDMQQVGDFNFDQQPEMELDRAMEVFAYGEERMDIGTWLEPTFLDDGSLLSEAVSISASNEGTVTLPATNEMPLANEIKTEIPEMEKDSGMPQMIPGSTGSFNEFRGDYFGDTGTLVTVPIIIKQEEPMNVPKTSFSSKRPRKQAFVIPASSVGQPELNIVKKPPTHGIPYDVNNNVPNSPPMLLVPIQQSQKVKRESKPKAKAGDLLAIKKKSFKQRGKKREKKVPLYLKRKEQCKDDKEWEQAKRAINTKKFHEKQKKKVQAAEIIFQLLLQRKTKSFIKLLLRDGDAWTELVDNFPHLLVKNPRFG